MAGEELCFLKFERELEPVYAVQLTRDYIWSNLENLRKLVLTCHLAHDLPLYYLPGGPNLEAVNPYLPNCSPVFAFSIPLGTLAKTGFTGIPTWP